MLHTPAGRNHRTLRDVVVPLGRLDLVTGANSSGKSNIHKALRLLAATRAAPQVTPSPGSGDAASSNISIVKPVVLRASSMENGVLFCATVQRWPSRSRAR